FGRHGRKRFVFCLASDADCNGPLGASRIGWESGLYRYGLKKAGLVIAQTRKQQDSLYEARRIRAQVIPMAVELPLMNGANNAKNGVLWVGRIMPEKRLEWLFEAARRCPEFAFHVVGTPNKDSDYA